MSIGDVDPHVDPYANESIAKDQVEHYWLC